MPASFDVAFLSCLPGMVVMAAADEAELTHMVATAASIDDTPSAFRYPRGEGTGVALPKRGTPLPIGKGRVLREGSAVALLSFGARLPECLVAADQLAGFGLPATVADARFAKPLDMDLLRQLARNHEVLITVEEGSSGGFGAQVLQALAREGLLDRGLKVRTLTLPDCFIEQNKPQAMYARGRPRCSRHRRFRVLGARQGWRCRGRGAARVSRTYSSLQSWLNVSTASARPCSASVAVVSPILTVTGPFSRNTASTGLTLMSLASAKVTPLASSCAVSPSVAPSPPRR